MGSRCICPGWNPYQLKHATRPSAVWHWGSSPSVSCKFTTLHSWNLRKIIWEGWWNGTPFKRILACNFFPKSFFDIHVGSCMWCAKRRRKASLQVASSPSRPAYKYTRSGRVYGKYLVDHDWQQGIRVLGSEEASFPSPATLNSPTKLNEFVWHCATSSSN